MFFFCQCRSALLVVVAILLFVCCCFFSSSPPLVVSAATISLKSTEKSTVIRDVSYTQVLAIEGTLCEGCSLTIGPGVTMNGAFDIEIRPEVFPGAVINITGVTSNGRILFTKPQLSQTCSSSSPAAQTSDSVKVFIEKSVFNYKSSTAMTSHKAPMFNWESILVCGSPSPMPHVRVSIEDSSLITQCDRRCEPVTAVVYLNQFFPLESHFSVLRTSISASTLASIYSGSDLHALSFDRGAKLQSLTVEECTITVATATASSSADMYGITVQQTSADQQIGSQRVIDIVLSHVAFRLDARGSYTNPYAVRATLYRYSRLWFLHSRVEGSSENSLAKYLISYCNVGVVLWSLGGEYGEPKYRNSWNVTKYFSLPSSSSFSSDDDGSGNASSRSSNGGGGSYSSLSLAEQIMRAVPVSPLTVYNVSVQLLQNNQTSPNDPFEISAALGRVTNLTLSYVYLEIKRGRFVFASFSFDKSGFVDAAALHIKNIHAEYHDIQENVVVRFQDTIAKVKYIEVDNVTQVRHYGTSESNVVLFNCTCGGSTDIVIRNVHSRDGEAPITNSLALAFIYLEGIRSIYFANSSLSGIQGNAPSSHVFFGAAAGETYETSIVVEHNVFEGGSRQVSCGFGVVQGQKLGKSLYFDQTTQATSTPTMNKIVLRGNRMHLTKLGSISLIRCYLGFASVRIRELIVEDEDYAPGSNVFCAFPGKTGIMDRLTFRCPPSYMPLSAGASDQVSMRNKETVLEMMKSAGSSITATAIDMQMRCTETKSWIPPIITDSQSLSQRSLSLTDTLLPTPTRTRPPTRSTTFMPAPPSARRAAAIERAASLATTAATLSILSGAGGPVAMDAGRAIVSLGAINRCANYEKAVAEAVVPEAVEKEFVDDYLYSSLKIPESPLPFICFGDERGACIRGAVLANLIALFLACIVALCIGLIKTKTLQAKRDKLAAAAAAAAKKSSALSSSSSSSGKNSGPSSSQKKRRPTSSPPSRGGRGRRQQYHSSRSAVDDDGNDDQQQELEDMMLTASPTSPAAASPTTAAESVEDSSHTTSTATAEQQQQQNDALRAASIIPPFLSLCRFPLVLGHTSAMLLAPWAQVAASLIAAHDIPSGDTFFWGIMCSILVWIALSVVFCRIVMKHLDYTVNVREANDPNDEAEEERRQRQLEGDEESGRGGTTTTSVVNNKDRCEDWRLEESVINYGVADPKFPAWRTKVGTFVRSDTGRWLFVGTLVWTEGARKGAVAQGRAGSMLWQCGSIINKMRGVHILERPLELRATPKGKKLSQGKRNQLGGVLSRQFKIDDLGTKLAPYAFFISCVITAITGFVVGIGIAAPKSCQAVRILLVLMSATSFVATAALRQYLIPARNVTAAIADCLLCVGCIMAEAMSTSETAETVVMLATGMSIACGFLSAGKHILLRICNGTICLREEMWRELSASLAGIFGGSASMAGEVTATLGLV